MDRTDQEYGDEALDGLVPPSQAVQKRSSLEFDEPAPYAPSSAGSAGKSIQYYLATFWAFVIIYRTEVALGTTLAFCIGVAITTSSHSRHPKINPFQAAHIGHDYSTEIKSKYDLSLGSIDHWCLRGDDNSCRCEDPLEPMSKRSSKKWEGQHIENTKVAQAAVLKLLKDDDPWSNYEDYMPTYDDMWIEGLDLDDWIDGEGPRFELDDDARYDPFSSVWGMDDFAQDDDDGFGVPTETGGENDGRKVRELGDDTYELDVVFVGDSITEQRQGTSMGKPVEDYAGIKEVFSKTFNKDKEGDYNGIAMGIAGDTAPNLLWRLMNQEMPYGLTPKVWWVHIGINDLTMKGCSEEVVLLGIFRVVEEIQERRPEDIIVVNSLLPVKRNEHGLLEHLGKHHEDIALKKKEKDLADDEMSSKRTHIDLWPSIASINEELSNFASKHPKIKFFNADSVFVEERQDGKYLKLDLMMDNVHPNVAGHNKWNNAIKKRLKEILKED